MTLLASCWFIVESIVIPEGFLKWFYLSFYIHPILLFLCQILLWLKLLQRWLFLLVLLLFRMISYVLGLCIIVLRFSKYRILSFVSSTQVASTRVPADQMAMEESENPHTIPCIQNQAVACATSMPCYYAYELQILNSDAKFCHKVGLHLQEIETLENSDTLGGDDSSLNSYDSFGFCTSPPPPVYDMHMTVNLSPVSSSISSLPDMELNLEGEESGFPRDCDISEHLQSEPTCNINSPTEQELIDKRPEQQVDALYDAYAERMKWFDVLCRDRLYGIDAIQKDLERSSRYVSWDKMAREKLIKILRSDFELVYVAQSCLSWEALRHQYWKVEAVASSTFENGVFHKSIADRFQKFQILLERFMEDELYEGKWYISYAHKRFSVKNLLQVPEVSGYTEGDNERTNGEAMKATEVLKAIENCMKVFWLFVAADCRKPIWQIGSSIHWTGPPVEDPRDLELFYDLRKTLKKKELMVKGLKGKKKCWLKKSVNPMLIESEKYDLLFTMIDLKLVRKVLRISAISTSELQWCQTKLNNIQFKEGKVHRSRACYLFPSS